MMTLDEMAAVIAAAKTGKQLQYRGEGGESPWEDCDFTPAFDFSRLDYREKPREPRRCWGIRYSDGSWNYADRVDHYYLTTAKDDEATEVVEFVEVVK